jgi:hypothetical protein
MVLNQKTVRFGTDRISRTLCPFGATDASGVRGASKVSPPTPQMFGKKSRFEKLKEYLTNINAKINIIFKTVFLYPEYAGA